MKKSVKKLSSIVCIMIMVLSIMPLTSGAANIGDIIGYAQPTDIVATINGYQLESYNVNDLTYICVEDLRHYGFDVYFDMYTKSLSVSRNNNVTEINPQVSNPDFWAIGSNNSWENILYTDIATYVDNSYVASFNINGRTIINFNELSRFGQVNYDNNRREISLTVDDMIYNPVALCAQLIAEEISIQSNPDWDMIIRAKGDVFMIIGTAKSYFTNADKNNFIYNVIPKDKQDSRKFLDTLRLSDIDVSSIYVEYKNSDGTMITSYQMY